MFDGKILTAVLATLAAVATALNGGALEASQLEASTVSAPGDATFDQIVPESLSLGGLLEKPEPTNEVHASFKLQEWNNNRIPASKATVEASNLSSFNIGSRKVESSSQVSFYGFNGKVNPGESTDIKGRAAGFTSGPVNVSGRFRMDKKLSTDRVEIRDVERSKLKLENVEGVVDSNSSVTDIKDSSTDVDINSFSGDITIYPGNRTVILDGKVDRLVAGDLKIGS